MFKWLRKRKIKKALKEMGSDLARLPLNIERIRKGDKDSDSLEGLYLKQEKENE